MSSQRLRILDGLRGICALTVAIHHCLGVFNHTSPLEHGYLAVDVFFILSGFVIALTYEQRLVSGWPLLLFMRARAFRLLPTFWLGVLLNAFVFLSFPLPDADGVVLSTSVALVTVLGTALMIPQMTSPDRYMFPTLTVAWSLLVEEIVNVSYGSLLFRVRTRWLIVLVALSWGVLAVSGVPWFLGYKFCDLWIAILRGFGGFLTGVVICRLYNSPLFDRLPAMNPTALLATWIAVAALPINIPPAIDAFIVTGYAPLLIALLIRSDNMAPTWYKPLGAMSYPLYVTHWTIVRVAIATPAFAEPNPLLGVGLVLSCVFVAWILFRLTAPKRLRGMRQAVQPSR